MIAKHLSSNAAERSSLKGCKSWSKTKVYASSEPAHLLNSTWYRNIGCSDIKASCLCLGCMQFGEGISETKAVNLLDAASDFGINFFDVAEMYPVPQRSETQGASEEILGRWLKRSNKRHNIHVATKVSGPGDMPWIREGPIAVDAKNIMEAIEGSLKRLQIDCIDLLQIHWPDRYVPMFGSVEYNTSWSYSSTPFEEQLEAIYRAMSSGKIKYFGLSNETSWGIMKFLRAAESFPMKDRFCSGATELGFNGLTNKKESFLPISINDVRSRLRPISLQNAYSLTCRTFESSLAECCHEEGIGLLAYSPLAMGLLTGKYLASDGGPTNARLNKYKGRYAEAESRYGPKPNVYEAVKEYVNLARLYGISPTELSIRFVLSNPLVGSAVIGVTCVEQLEELVAASHKPPLEEDLASYVDKVHLKFPNPTP